MKKRVVSVLIGVGLMVSPLAVRAEDVPTETNNVVLPQMLITELQANGSTAEQEFIEIYNASTETVDLAYLSIERATASSVDDTSWQKLVTANAFTGVLEGGSYLIIAHRDYFALSAEYRYSSNLSNSGGHIRMVWDDPLTTTVEKYELDRIGWGAAQMPEGLTVPAAGTSHSLQRCLLETGEYEDSGNNSLDFMEFDEPTPAAASLDCNPVEEEDEPAGEIPTDDDETNDETPAEEEPDENAEDEVVTASLLPLQVTELLPNPASPLIDADDEYVELYNPNDSEVNLKGWKLETGSSFSYRVHFIEEVIAPKSYLLVKSSTSNLTLSNTAGAARLVDDEGAVISQSDPYQKAKDGEAWAMIDGVWQWTTTSTPEAVNVLTIPSALSALSASSKKAAAKKTTVKKSTAKKAAAKKTTKKESKPKETVARSIFEDPPTDGQLLPVNPVVLAVVGVGALGYSLYEYRHDLRNRLERLRRYRALRRAARAKA